MPMRFPYLKAARVRLQERKNACLKSDVRQAQHYAAVFLSFIRENPVIRPIVHELWLVAQQKRHDLEKIVNADQRRLELPIDPTDCAACLLTLLDRFVMPDLQVPNYMEVFGAGTNRFQDMADRFFSQVLGPLSSYIDERIDDGDLLLYMLTRYRRECMWFEAGELADLAANADSRKLEEVLDGHLRAWLFREGVDYPFSTPRTPSGRPDIVVWQGEEPLAIEVKVFDGHHRDTRHVSRGLWQAYRYAHDYGKPFGYLVVFNTSSFLLSYENIGAADGPPCVVVSGLNVFIVTIDFGTNRESASKEKPLETKIVPCPEGSDLETA